MDTKKQLKKQMTIGVPSLDFDNVSDIEMLVPQNRATMALPRAFDSSMANKMKQKLQLNGCDFLEKDLVQSKWEDTHTRVEGFKHKERHLLSIAQLFDIGRIYPEEMDGVAFENRLRVECHKLVSEANKKTEQARKETETLQGKLSIFEQKYSSDTRSVALIPRIDTQVRKLIEQQKQGQRDFDDLNLDCKQQKDLNKDIANRTNLRMVSQEENFKELNEYARRSVDYYEKIQEMGDMVREGLQEAMENMMIDVQNAIHHQKDFVEQTRYDCDRMEKKIDGMVADLVTHETICCEIAQKFDQQNDLLGQFTDHIEALKENALITDLHMEAFQPLQTAAIAYEVAKGLVQKSKASKFEKHFMKKTIKTLEKNCLQVCDPQMDNFKSPYSKFNYHVPVEQEQQLSLKKGKEKPPPVKEHTKVLEKVTFGNIHILNKKKDESTLEKRKALSQIDTAEGLIRRKLSLSKVLLLTGEMDNLTKDALALPLQTAFEQIQRKNIDLMKIVLDKDQLQNFHVTKQSKINSFLNYAKIPPGYLDKLVKKINPGNKIFAAIQNLKKAQEQEDTDNRTLAQIQKQGGAAKAKKFNGLDLDAKHELSSDEEESEDEEAIKTQAKMDALEQEIKKVQQTVDTNKSKIETHAIGGPDAETKAILDKIQADAKAAADKPQIILQEAGIQCPDPRDNPNDASGPRGYEKQLQEKLRREQAFKLETIQNLLEEKINSTEAVLLDTRNDFSKQITATQRLAVEEVAQHEASLRDQMMKRMDKQKNEMELEYRENHREVTETIENLAAKQNEHEEILKIEHESISEELISEVDTDSEDLEESESEYEKEIDTSEQQSSRAKSSSQSSIAPTQKNRQIEPKLELKNRNDEFKLDFEHTKPKNIMQSQKMKHIEQRLNQRVAKVRTDQVPEQLAENTQKSAQIQQVNHNLPEVSETQPVQKAGTDGQKPKVVLSKHTSSRQPSPAAKKSATDQCSDQENQPLKASPIRDQQQPKQLTEKQESEPKSKSTNRSAATEKVPTIKKRVGILPGHMHQLSSRQNSNKVSDKSEQQINIVLTTDQIQVQNVQGRTTPNPLENNSLRAKQDEPAPAKQRKPREELTKTQAAISDLKSVGAKTHAFVDTTQVQEINRVREHTKKRGKAEAQDESSVSDRKPRRKKKEKPMPEYVEEDTTEYQKPTMVLPDLGGEGNMDLKGLANKTLANAKMYKQFSREKQTGKVKRHIQRVTFAAEKTVRKDGNKLPAYTMYEQQLQANQLRSDQNADKAAEKIKREEQKVQRAIDKAKRDEERKKRREDKIRNLVAKTPSGDSKESDEEQDQSEASDESNSGSDSEDEEGDGYEDEEQFTPLADFEMFKTLLLQILTEKEQELLHLRTEQCAFLGENLRLLDKVEKVDWNLMRKAELLTADSLAEFARTVLAFQKSVKGDFKNWRHKNENLQQKYENVTMWVKQFTQMNEVLKDEFFNSQCEVRKNLSMVSEYINLQISKDFQDGVDRQNLNLIGVRDKQSLAPASPTSASPDFKAFENTAGQSVITDKQAPWAHEPPIIGVDGKCLNCHGTAGREKQTIMNCFKMACLNYKSSKVPMPMGPSIARTDVTHHQAQQLRELQESLIAQENKLNSVKIELKNQNEATLQKGGFSRPRSPRFLQEDINNTWQKVMKASPDREPDDINMFKNVEDLSVQNRRYQTIDAPTRSSLHHQRPATNAGNFHPNANWGSSLIGHGHNAETQASSKSGTASQNNRRSIALSGLGPMSNVTLPVSIPAVESRNGHFDNHLEESSRCPSTNFVVSPRNESLMATTNANLQQKVAELAARNEALIKMCNSRQASKSSTGMQQNFMAMKVKEGPRQPEAKSTRRTVVAQQFNTLSARADTGNLTKSVNLMSNTTVGMASQHSRQFISPINDFAQKDTKVRAVHFSQNFNKEAGSTLQKSAHNQGLEKGEIMSLRRNYIQNNRK